MKSMKKWVLAVLVLCLLLPGCTKKPVEDTNPTGDPSQSTHKDPVDLTVEQDDDDKVLYRNPLNGEPLDEAWSGRPTAVVINNLKAALPHHGVSQADFFYELETEGGITRCLAVFSDISVVDKVGPIRSARTFFNSIALSYDAPIVHCGGSVRGRNAGYEDSSDKIDNWAHLDQVYNGAYFFRDEDRYYYQGYNWEHTLFSNGEKIAAGLEARDISEPTDRSTDFGLTFDDEVSLDGQTANSIVFSFRGDKTTSFTYDSATGKYKTSQYGSDYIDANTNEVVTFQNLMFLYTKQWNRHDGEYNRSYYDLVGSGDGYLAIGGQIVPIKWSRDALRGSFHYTLADGTPITLNVGNTYVGIACTSSTPVSYQ